MRDPPESWLSLTCAVLVRPVLSFAVGISVDPWPRLFLVLGPPVVEEKGCRGRCWLSPPDRSALALAAIGYMTGGGGSAYRGIAVRLNWDVSDVSNIGAGWWTAQQRSIAGDHKGPSVSRVRSCI